MDRARRADRTFHFSRDEAPDVADLTIALDGIPLALELAAARLRTTSIADMVDQIRARHILMQPNEILDEATVAQRLSGIREDVLGGDDFGAIAQALSEDPASAAENGDLGWVVPGDFVPEFAQRLEELEIGELSEPFRTRFGWHIVEVTDRRTYDTTEEVKEQRCAETIRASKMEEQQQLWLQQIRDQAFVELRL